ncbi:MAG: CoA-binding protein [Bacteroidota bacterium]|nr:CoA-binding protein [Bacteroidota bacterium]MEC8514837.1 CoA-binding protein [Bacteroidota bacterium]|tara:strand:- start:195 stop:569 length:375 start_codon:yes stop_codon:yes gene_type:complete
MLSNNKNHRVLVLGASLNPTRYAHKVALQLNRLAYDVVLVGHKPGIIDGLSIETYIPNKSYDTVTLYLGAKNQQQYHDQLLKLKPKRIIFNPGAENSVFQKLAIQKDIEAFEACTLVMLSMGTF